ncbi:DUF7218 family protein [Micropruina glycogenica]|uniref:DUF7218 family protein n=1 Tax=Micropruina glycogenica TaxID=75385 RepID=UPI003CD08094
MRFRGTHQSTPERCGRRGASKEKAARISNAATNTSRRLPAARAQLPRTTTNAPERSYSSVPEGVQQGGFFTWVQRHDA